MRSIGIFLFIIALLVTGAYFLGKQERTAHRTRHPFSTGAAPSGGYAHPEDQFTDEIAKNPKDPQPRINRAEIYFTRHEYAQAEQDLQAALTLTSDPVTKLHVHELLSETHAKMGAFMKCRKDLEAIVAINPNYHHFANNLAWLLATCPDKSVRDGKQAITYGKMACDQTNWEEPAFIDTLAAAYAEAGQYDKAVKYQQQAINLVPADAKPDYASRLQLYKAHKPYREDPRQL